MKFKQYITESNRPSHWPKTMEELEKAFEKFYYDKETGEVYMGEPKFHDDLTVSIKGNVDIYINQCENELLPFKFKDVSGKFSLFSSYNSLGFKSLIGCPDSCDSFQALGGRFTTLDGMPKEIKSKCTFNSCRQINTLESLPQGVYSLVLSYIPSLTSLKGLPREVKSLEIKSIPAFNESQFQYLPAKVGFELSFYENDNLRTLKDIHIYLKECEQFNLIGQPIFGNILGLMEIKGLKEVLFDDMVSRTDDGDVGVSDLIAKHLQDPDVFEFQQDLIDNGFKKHAQL